jgi:tape measure domain-containing protein
MSLNLGSLEATLRLNTAQFRKGLLSASNTLNKHTSGMKGGFGALAKSMGPVTMGLAAVTAAATAAALAFGKMTSTLAKTQIEFESIDRLILFGAKTTQRANQDFASLKNISKDLGVDLAELSKAYAKLTAAAEGTVITHDEVIATLKGVSQAGLAMGANAEIMKRLFIGLQQMVGKGVISMEELRQQVGEALPIAIGAMSRALGISVKSMIDLISEGKVTSEAVVLLGAQLQKETQAVADSAKNAMVAMVARMKTAWFELKRVFLTGQLGAPVGAEMVTVGKIIEAVTKALIWMQPIVIAIKNYFLLWGESLREAQGWLSAIGKALTVVVLTGVLAVAEAFRAVVDMITAMVKGVQTVIGWLKKFDQWTKEPVDTYDFVLGVAPMGEKSMKQLQKVTADTAEATVEVAKGVVEAEKQVGLSSDAIFEKYADYIKNIQDMAAGSGKKMSEMAESLMEATGSSLGGFFSDVVKDFDSAFSNLFENLLNRIFEVIIELKVIKPIMDSIFKTPGGSGIWGAITGGVQKAFGYAEGGIIPEPVVGVGLKSGAGYTFGERGPELVAPMGAAGQGSTSGEMNQYNVTIQALDSQSAVEYMKRNPGAVLGPITTAIQHGNKGLIGALRTAM